MKKRRKDASKAPKFFKIEKFLYRVIGDKVDFRYIDRPDVWEKSSCRLDDILINRGFKKVPNHEAALMLMVW